MSINQRVHSFIEAVYDAAMDEAQWPLALRELSELCQSEAATFWVLDSSAQPRLPIFHTVNLDPTFIKEYLAGQAALDPTVQYLVNHPDQPIVHDGLVISEREKDRHPYYDWHHRHADLRFRMIGQVCPAPSAHAGVALLRGRKVGRYEAQDIEQFALLHRHLQRALAIGFRLGALGALQQCTNEILDRNPAAILFIDERKCVVYANSNAKALAAHGDGIRYSAEGVTALRKQDNEKLQAMIAQAFLPIDSSQSSPGGVLRVARPSGRRPYVILVAPLSKQYAKLSISRPAACIVITDPDVSRPLPASRLRAAFGLTEAEARLAAQLVRGEELRTAAVNLGITYGTARVRLAEIFHKTDTHHQRNLVKLLLTTMAIG
jgi:DNA-binding CsgD family transcriptional regulator